MSRRNGTAVWFLSVGTLLLVTAAAVVWLTIRVQTDVYIHDRDPRGTFVAMAVRALPYAALVGALAGVALVVVGLWALFSRSG